MKLCTKCKKEKDIEEFTERKDSKVGTVSWCHSCRREAGAKYSQDNSDKKAAYQRSWRVKNRARNNEIGKKSRLKHIKRHYARQLISAARVLGLVVPPEGCMACKVKETLEGHHVDYDRPLLIIWLCKNCHSKTRRKYNRGNIDQLLAKISEETILAFWNGRIYGR